MSKETKYNILTQEDYKLIIEAVEEKMGKYMVGDRMYREYESLSAELKRRSASAIARRTWE
jgi:hypothetical protein